MRLGRALAGSRRGIISAALRRAAVTTLAVAVGLLGCGSEEDDGPTRTVTVQPGATVPIEGDEYSFDPGAIVVESGGEEVALTLSLKNVGGLAHNARVFREGDEIGGTPTFKGDEERAGKVTLAAGEYELICTVGNHEQLGMTGTITVR